MGNVAIILGNDVVGMALLMSANRLLSLIRPRESNFGSTFEIHIAIPVFCLLGRVALLTPRFA